MAKRRGHGEGTIYPMRNPDGSIKCYAAGVEMERRPNGRRNRKVIYGATRKEVAEKLKALHRDQEKGFNLKPDQTTVSVFLARWLEDVVKLSNRYGTYDNYKKVVRLYIDPEIGTQRLCKLTPEHVQAMLNTLHKRDLSSRTVQLARAVLRRALNQAVKWNIIERNPAVPVEPPRSQRTKIMPLNLPQAQTLLVAAKEHRLEAMYRVALSLGLRKGEVLALTWQDVDFERGILRVEASIQHQAGKLVRALPKTQSSIRLLALPKTLVEALRAHKDQQDKERENPDWQEHDLVFPSDAGTPIGPRNIVRSFKRLLKRAGLPETTRFHDLRHSCATLLIAQGEHPKVVSELLGHSTIKLTMDTYAHVLPETQRKAVAGLDESLLGAEEQTGT